MTQVSKGRPRLQLDVERIRQLREQGVSVRQIGKTCGVSKDTIRNVLSNPGYKVSNKHQDTISPSGDSGSRPEALVDRRGSQGGDSSEKQGERTLSKRDEKLLESSGIMQVGAYLKDDTLPGPAPSESSEIVQQKQSPMAHTAQIKKEQMKERFLQALEQKFSVARAAKLAGVPRRTVYKWRESDAIFGEEWDDRREGHLDAIEDAMMEGALKMTQSYHAVLALGMLNAHRSELYSPKHRVEHTGAGGGPILLAVAAKIKLMDTDELRGELGKLLGPSLVEVQGPKPES